MLICIYCYPTRNIRHLCMLNHVKSFISMHIHVGRGISKSCLAASTPFCTDGAPAFQLPSLFHRGIMNWVQVQWAQWALPSVQHILRVFQRYRHRCQTHEALDLLSKSRILWVSGSSCWEPPQCLSPPNVSNTCVVPKLRNRTWTPYVSIHGTRYCTVNLPKNKTSTISVASFLLWLPTSRKWPQPRNQKKLPVIIKNGMLEHPPLMISLF